MSKLSPDQITHLSFLHSGTILSCPDCGRGLYMTTQRVGRDETFEGAVKPLADVPEYKRGNLPKRCPFCGVGEWWYPPGYVHTLQYGWVA